MGAYPVLDLMAIRVPIYAVYAVFEQHDEKGQNRLLAGLPPAFEEIARTVARDGRIAAKQDAAHSNLPHSLAQQCAILLPHARDGNAGRVKV